MDQKEDVMLLMTSGLVVTTSACLVMLVDSIGLGRPLKSII